VSIKPLAEVIETMRSQSGAEQRWPACCINFSRDKIFAEPAV